MEKFEDLIRSPKPILIDFFAEWCGPCRAMAPILEQVKRQVDDNRIIKVDVDKHETLAARYQIQSVPTFVLFKNGEVLWRHAGVIQANDLTRVIKQYT